MKEWINLFKRFITDTPHTRRLLDPLTCCWDNLLRVILLLTYNKPFS